MLVNPVDCAFTPAFVPGKSDAGRRAQYREAVAIDGKTVRGSHRGEQRALHLVSAYGSGLGMALGQVHTADKSNKITTITELLDALLLKGAILTIDAMACQQRIARKIIEAQADYVLALKDNQRALARLVRGVFDSLERWPELHAGTFDQYREIEKDHGRIETRRCVAQDISSRWPSNVDGRWPGLRSVVMVEATREIAGVASTQRRYYISSLPADTCRIAHAVRSHWRIENNMHLVPDMAFGEDQCRVKVENAELCDPASPHDEPAQARYENQGGPEDTPPQGRCQRSMPCQPARPISFMQLPCMLCAQQK
ncbi:UNVERIFIED_ORG: putative transposase YbfD/YdcC [Paraburkholderia sediminicola]|nr:putative transposase YbfD/YdcC [Paraburkholderia sediminicola]